MTATDRFVQTDGVTVEPSLVSRLLSLLGDDGVEESYTQSEYDLLSEADRSHLVRKVITNSRGKKQVVWVRATADNKGDTKTRQQVLDARSLVAKAVADPNSLNPEQFKQLVEHLETVNRDEIRNLLRQVGEKVGGDKVALAERLAAKVKAGRTAGVGDALARGDTPVPNPGAKVALQPVAGEPWQANGSDFHGVSVSTSRTKRETAKFRGVNRDMETRTALGPSVTIADAKNAAQNAGDGKFEMGKVERPYAAGGTHELAAEITAGAAAVYQRRGLDRTGKEQVQGVTALWPDGTAAKFNVYYDEDANVVRYGGSGLAPADDKTAAAIRVLAHHQSVSDAVAAGKPVPPEVAADYPDLAEKIGFTGVAANGVRYLNGVPQKSADNKGGAQ